MERKVTWRTKGFKQYKNGSKGKNPGQAKTNPTGGMDVCVVFVVRKVVWNVKWHEGRKDLNSTKMDQRGKTPDRQKKNPTGGMDVCVVFVVRTVVWSVKWHEGRKDLNSTKMDQRGKTPDRQKKNPTGGMNVCVVLCCKDGNMERKVTWRTKGLKQYKNGSKVKKTRTEKKIPPGAWMFVSCEWCVLLSGTGLCDEPIPRPEESYRLCCVSQCDQKKLQTRHWNGKTGVARRGRLKKKLPTVSHKSEPYVQWKYSMLGIFKIKPSPHTVRPHRKLASFT
jgi:hypothetical protein